MYDNIASLRLQEGNNKETLVSAMVSAEGEVMEFRQNIPAEGRVEDWMTNVLVEVRRTNRLITKEAVFTYCADNIDRYVNESLSSLRRDAKNDFVYDLPPLLLI